MRGKKILLKITNCQILYVTIALELTMNLDKWIPCHIPYDISGLKIHHFCCYQWILFMHSKNVWKRTKKNTRQVSPIFVKIYAQWKYFRFKNEYFFLAEMSQIPPKAGPSPSIRWRCWWRSIIGREVPCLLTRLSGSGLTCEYLKEHLNTPSL